jgi:hypothetical protein
MELRQLAVVLPADLVDGVYAKAAATGKTMAELVGEVLSAHVDDDTPLEAEIPKKPRSKARKP